MQLPCNPRILQSVVKGFLCHEHVSTSQQEISLHTKKPVAIQCSSNSDRGHVVRLSEMNTGCVPLCRAKNGAPGVEDMLTMTPCDLFQVIEGRTLWLVGDSLTQVKLAAIIL